MYNSKEKKKILKASGIKMKQENKRNTKKTK